MKKSIQGIKNYVFCGMCEDGYKTYKTNAKYKFEFLHLTGCSLLYDIIHEGKAGDTEKRVAQHQRTGKWLEEEM